jgi:IS5 family transposase
MVAMSPGERAALDKDDALDRIVNEIEYLKASVRAKVEHPFRGDQTALWLRKGALP